MPFRFQILILLFFLVSVSKAEEKKFEWGAGVLSIYAHHYRGSDQTKLWTIPTPYFSYSSDTIEAEHSFIRGIFFRSDRFEFKLSLMAGLNVESKTNRAREGMPSLDYSIEAGPLFLVKLWKSENNLSHVNFEWPIRKSFAVGLDTFKTIGFFSVPYLNFIHKPTPATWNWHFEISICAMLADNLYHNYFYGVDKQYENSERKAYKAHGGYSGLQTTLVLNKTVNNFVIIPFFRWDYLDKAKFVNSPLVKTKNYALAGLGFFWLL